MSNIERFRYLLLRRIAQKKHEVEELRLKCLELEAYIEGLHDAMGLVEAQSARAATIRTGGPNPRDVSGRTAAEIVSSLVRKHGRVTLRQLCEAEGVKDEPSFAHALTVATRKGLIARRQIDVTINGRPWKRWEYSAGVH